MSDIADRYRTLADAFERKIAAVDSEQWSNQSPCEAWTARSVVDHVVDVHGMMLGQIDRGLSPAPVDDGPMAAFQSARADVEAVLDDPALSHTEYDGAFGRTNIAATIDQFLGFDLVVHGWDLARATGQDDTIDPSEVERAWAFAQQMGDNLRTPKVCGPAVDVPDGSPMQDRLLGLLGRHPG